MMAVVRRLTFLRVFCGLAACGAFLQILQGAGISRGASRVKEETEAVVLAAAISAGSSTNATIAEVEEDITKLPAALRPSNFTWCCTQLSTKTKQIRSPYYATCHTEQACENNTLYPFRSEYEKKFLEPYILPVADKADYRRICREAANELKPNVTWCKIEPSGDRNASTFSIPQSFYPTGCSYYNGMGGDSGPYDRLLLFPTHKLAFCGIPKSGISRWLQFLRFTNGARDYQDVP